MAIFTSVWSLRLLGIAGIAGAILFVLGDLLYNHVPGSKDSPTVKMSRMPAARLLNAGTLGLVGCWLYLLGALHVFIAFSPASSTFDLIVLLAIGAVMICYGISHTAYFAIASGAQAAVQSGSDAETGGKLGNALYQRLVYITYVPVAIASLMMIYGIVTGSSMYPLWMVIFQPVIIYLLKAPVTRLLRGRLQEVVRDSYDNLTLLIFYALSTAVLWNGMT
jgi:hypothetical protein